MTKTEHILMGKQIEHLLKEIDELKAGIINLEANAPIIAVSNALASASGKIGVLQWRYLREKVTEDEQE